MTIAEIVEKLEGVLKGDGSIEITGLAGLRDAESGDITFFTNPRYTSAVRETRASAVVVSKDWDGACPCAVLKVSDPDKAFLKLAAMFAPESVEVVLGIHATAVVAEDVKFGANISVGPYCVIEPGVRIGDRSVISAGCYIGYGTVMGDDCRLYPHVTIRERTVTGDRVMIHNGAVIGSDGFGYSREESGWKKIPQVGFVEIGDDVEIGANASIDRARFGKTVISNGVKIDNLVQVAHNVKIGENTAIASQVGISGSTTIGRNVMIGGQAGLAGHLEVGDQAVVGGGAGVTKDVSPRTYVSGYPAMPHKKAAKAHAHMMRLPDLKQRVKQLEKRIEELEK